MIKSNLYDKLYSNFFQYKLDHPSYSYCNINDRSNGESSLEMDSYLIIIIVVSNLKVKAIVWDKRH